MEMGVRAKGHPSLTALYSAVRAEQLVISYLSGHTLLLS